MIRLAASNSSAADKARADVICDGVDDQVEINAAIAADEGSVFLSAGQYNLTAEAGLPTGVTGSILIQRSNVVLEGEGSQSILFCEDAQRCNMIRTVGEGLSSIYVRNLHFEPNAAENAGIGPTDWLEICPIKTKTTDTLLNNDIWVESCSFGNAVGVGAYMWGDSTHVRNCTFRGAEHDVAELCTGSGGDITGCTCVLENGDWAGHVFGTDDHNNATIANNTTVVRTGSYIVVAAHRLWPSRYRNIVVNNKVISEGGAIPAAFQLQGYENTMMGNVVRGNDYDSLSRTAVEVNAGTVTNGNVLLYCALTFLPTAGGDWLITNNVLRDCVLPDEGRVIITNNISLEDGYLLAEPGVFITDGEGNLISGCKGGHKDA